MNKKWMAPFAASAVAASLVLVPLHGYASIQDDLNREIEKIKQQEAAAEKKRQESEKLKADLKKQIEQETKSIQELDKEIEEIGKKVSELKKKRAEINLQLLDAEQQRKSADERVKSRDQLLKSRVRLMYMNGSVSFLDVLFSATSFSDFLDRFHSLQLIVGKDKEILEANKQDRDEIAAKEKQIAQQFAEIKALVAQEEAENLMLTKTRKQKEVKIASLTKESKDAEDISEEQEASLVALAKKKSELYRKIEEAKGKDNPQKQQQQPAYSGGKLAWPVPSSSTITSPFGYRVDPIAKTNKLHKGIDISAPRGTAIVAAESGVVLIADWVRGYGNTVVIDHGNGIWTWYGHIREGGIMVKEGDTVKRGDKIAEVGSTGDSTGNHLHFEVRVNEEPVNPIPYVK